nr:hypothetical protein [Chloroflexia bacterium]
MIGEMLRTLDEVPDLFARLDQEMTPERANRYLSALESAPAPSQTARWGRTRVVERLLDEDGVLD